MLVNSAIGCSLFHVDERQGSKADKDEDIANESQVVILKLVRHNSLKLVLSQELPFLAIGAYVELCERVTGNLPIVVCPQYDTLQPHAALPDGGIGQSSVCAEIGRKVLDELWC